jgi:hypothetical protein
VDFSIREGDGILHSVLLFSSVLLFDPALLFEAVPLNAAPLLFPLFDLFPHFVRVLLFDPALLFDALWPLQDTFPPIQADPTTMIWISLLSLIRFK